MSQLGEAFRGQLGEDAKRIVAIMAATVAAVTDQTQDDLRFETQRGGLPPKIANAWQKKLYGQNTARASGFIFSRAPTIHVAFSTGVTVKPTKGKYLAIPTNFNRQGGRNSGKPRITPEQMAAMGKMTFVRRASNGMRYWMLRVTEASGLAKRDAQFYAGGLASLRVGTGKGRRALAAQIRKAGAVPMFVLAPQAVLKKRMSYDRIINAVPDLLEQQFIGAFDETFR